MGAFDGGGSSLWTPLHRLRAGWRTPARAAHRPGKASMFHLSNLYLLRNISSALNEGFYEYHLHCHKAEQ